MTVEVVVVVACDNKQHLVVVLEARGTGNITGAVCRRVIEPLYRLPLANYDVSTACLLPQQLAVPLIVERGELQAGGCSEEIEIFD